MRYSERVVITSPRVDSFLTNVESSKPLLVCLMFLDWKLHTAPEMEGSILLETSGAAEGNTLPTVACSSVSTVLFHAIMLGCGSIMKEKENSNCT